MAIGVSSLELLIQRRIGSPSTQEVWRPGSGVCRGYSPPICGYMKSPSYAGGLESPHVGYLVVGSVPQSPVTPRQQHPWIGLHPKAERLRGMHH